MHVMLSIRPEFCEAILAGKKRYEFRRRLFRDPEQIEVVFMYSTTPVQRIVGAFTIKTIKRAPPEKIWKECRRFAGISHRRFFEYFNSVNIAFAIEIEQVMRFEPIDPKTVLPRFHPPQSFVYVWGDLLRALQTRLQSSGISHPISSNESLRTAPTERPTTCVMMPMTFRVPNHRFSQIPEIRFRTSDVSDSSRKIM